MDPTPIVLVHGGSFDSSCWDPLLPHLRGPVLAVDLPGRGRHPAPLASVTLADCAESVVADIDAAGFDRVIVVGHSLAGATMPGLVPALSDRLAGMAFVACSVPPDGGTIVDLLSPEIQAMARDKAAEARNRGEPSVLDAETAMLMFGNGLTNEQAAFVLDRMVPDAPGLTNEPVASALLASVANTAWVLCTDDAIVLPEQQRTTAAMIGAGVVELSASHMAMVQRPLELAALLETLRARWELTEPARR